MKRLFSLILVLICALATVGCGKKPAELPQEPVDEFVEVCSVDFIYYSSSNSNTYYRKTIYSIIDIAFSKDEPATTEEYENAPEGNRFDFRPTYYNPINIETDKSNMSDYSVGDVYCWQTSKGYYKKAIVSVEFLYVSVKIVSDRVILIKTSDDNITLYSTDYYSISYFK